MKTSLAWASPLGSKGASERLLFVLAGIVFCALILGGTVVLLERDKSLALADEAERGKLLTSALASNVSRTMATLESTLDTLEHQLEEGGLEQPERQERIGNLAYRSTLLRSLHVLTTDGVVLASTSVGRRGERIDLPALGFKREILTSLEPGMLLHARDIFDLSHSAPDGGAANTSIPFARQGTLEGEKVVLLAMLNPAALFLDARSGALDESSFSAVFDYEGSVLAATRHTDYLPGETYSQLPLPGRMDDGPEHGVFLSQGKLSGESGNSYIVNYRGATLYPLVAVTGRSEEHALTAWRESSRSLMWLGLITAALVLLYTFTLWRVLGNRQKIEAELVRARDAAEQANAARGVFLSTMSHEIRTPMNAVLGMAELLRDTPLDAEQEDFVRTLQDSGTALLAIIDDVLDFSKIDAGKICIENLPMRLDAVATTSVEILSARAREKNLALTCDIGPGLPASVKGDQHRLRQVLLNLLGNAVKFTDSGQVLLRVRNAGTVGKNLLVRFEVSDTGIGIDPETAVKLFTPFTQADGSVTRRYGGTGLGLSICKRLVELMGGQIGLESEPGEGSVFWFEIPMQPLTPEQAAEQLCLVVSDETPDAGPDTGATPQPYTNCRILLVEDNPMNQKVALRQLRQLGYFAQIANNGEEALAALAGGQFQLVLMDCQMPVMDGFETTRRIRQLEAAGQPPVQIVAMTANAMEGDRQRCLECGMDDYLAKPILREQLATLLGRRLPIEDQAESVMADTVVPFSPDLLSESQMRATFGDDMEFQEEMLTLFLSTTGPVLDRIGGAIVTVDLETVQACGHRLFGSCGTVGANSLAALGRGAEQAAAAGDLNALRDIHAQMLDTYRQLEKKIFDLKNRGQF